ncbi:MAG: transposase [Gallionella sp.]|jgi:transposase
MTIPMHCNYDISRKSVSIFRSPLKKQYTEWATSGTRLNGTLVIEIRDSSGKVDFVGFGDLGKRGLPTPARIRRRVLLTDFASWRNTSAAEYAEAFGISQVGEGHEVFEFFVGGRRYVVPALVLMRAMFRPHCYVLAEIFRPQGIENICHPSMSDNSFSVEPARKWPSSAQQQPNSSIRQALTWLYCFPSARAMCGSVHERMMSGQIGLTVPIGHIRMAVHAVEIGTNSYVSAVTIVTLDTIEPPYEFAGDQAHHIGFNRSMQAATARRNSNRKCLRDRSLLRHPDGSTNISDQEWDELEPHFSSRCTAAELKHDQRLLLDGILAKLINGTSWRKTTYKVGNSVNASVLYRRLTRDGMWGRVESALRKQRSSNLQTQAQN